MEPLMYVYQAAFQATLVDGLQKNDLFSDVVYRAQEAGKAAVLGYYDTQELLHPTHEVVDTHSETALPTPDLPTPDLPLLRSLHNTAP